MHALSIALLSSTRGKSLIVYFPNASQTMFFLLYFIVGKSPYTDARVQSLHPGICSKATLISPGSVWRSPAQHWQPQSKALGNMPLRDPDIPRFGITIRLDRLSQHSGCNDCPRHILLGSRHIDGHCHLFIYGCNRCTLTYRVPISILMQRHIVNSI